MAFSLLREKRIRLEHFVPAISQFRSAAIALNRVAFRRSRRKIRSSRIICPAYGIKNEQETYYADCFGICSDSVRTDQCSIDISERK